MLPIPFIKTIVSVVFCCLFMFDATAQSKSIAREWNEILLDAIRNDFARPTLHARNLFHASALMYDAWAIHDDLAQPFLIGTTHQSFISGFQVDYLPAIRASKDLDQTISYAMYRLIMHRYAKAPKFKETKEIAEAFMVEKGYSTSFVSTDYSDGNPASLGNFMALEMIKYGLQDGANEQNDYVNINYEPINVALDPTSSAEVLDIDPNRWQPLFFNNFIDQSGNPIADAVPAFLSPEWGETAAFALENDDMTVLEHEGNAYKVFMDPGAPPYLGENDSLDYKWGFQKVLEWSSHLDIVDGVKMDISPASIGNVEAFPETIDDYKQFYPQDGRDAGRGRVINPITSEPYAPQMVLRGDYTRVLAEFWADGPDSETPPGHWFSIANFVMDHNLFERKYEGKGEVLSALEYDVKLYFMLGGAVHDAAIAAWSIKGYYDYIRPISAFRYMASHGQASDPTLSSYHPDGVLLVPGLIELILESDPDFMDPELIGKIKCKAWKGPTFIDNPQEDQAGVDWILATDWWPYQRSTFVTPPFAGYVSGHSTFSRAAAEVMTYITGDAYFPGGMGSFTAKKDNFLVFEQGPSTDVVLQWATYRDASDQCSLSRIWGGIHPPADDIPGRKIGRVVGFQAIRKANDYFQGRLSTDSSSDINNTIVYPNPVQVGDVIRIEIDGFFDDVFLINHLSEVVYTQSAPKHFMEIPSDDLLPGMYHIVLKKDGFRLTRKLQVF